ncbi:MAG: hypothetical protein JNM14_16205 [Ferruginibacter sp.]|nr:hypothetical protein [Ferruginibacter sp.]
MNIMKAFTITRHSVIALLTFTIIISASCKKSSADVNNEPDYGCDSKVALETLTNTAGLLVYNAAQGEWLVSIDLGSNRKFSCSFCDKSAYSAKVAGQSTTTAIPITVNGTVKRRYSNQIPITPTTGYVEVYVLSTAIVN